MQSPHDHEPPGMEARLLRAWPWFLAVGTLPPLLLAAGLAWRLSSVVDPAAQKALLLMLFTLVGWVVFYWTAVLTLGIGCWIVRVLKGPVRQADSYPVPTPDRFWA